MSVERSKSWLPSMFHRSKHASRQKDVMKKLKDNLRCGRAAMHELLTFAAASAREAAHFGCTAFQLWRLCSGNTCV